MKRSICANLKVLMMLLDGYSSSNMRFTAWNNSDTLGTNVMQHSIWTRLYQSCADKCLYIRRGGPRIEVISVYVDDLGLFANSMEGILRVKGELNGKFTMTDLGEMKKILGLWVKRDREGGTLKISQGPYIDTILTRFNMSDANPTSTLLSKSVKLTVCTEPTTVPSIDAP